MNTQTETKTLTPVHIGQDISAIDHQLFYHVKKDDNGHPVATLIYNAEHRAPWLVIVKADGVNKRHFNIAAVWEDLHLRLDGAGFNLSISKVRSLTATMSDLASAAKDLQRRVDRLLVEATPTPPTPEGGAGFRAETLDSFLDADGVERQIRLEHGIEEVAEKPTPTADADSPSFMTPDSLYGGGRGQTASIRNFDHSQILTRKVFHVRSHPHDDIIGRLIYNSKSTRDEDNYRQGWWWSAGGESGTSGLCETREQAEAELTEALDLIGITLIN